MVWHASCMIRAMFVNRVGELRALDEWWAQPGAQMGLVWGRRRVGKTWLLRRWASGKPTVLHVARNAPVAQELRAISNTAASLDTWGRRDLLARPFHDWDDLFDAFATASQSRPLLLIIDEFPELLRTTPHLVSALRAIWERLAGTCSLRLMLCGSAVRSMEALQSHDSPLFNRMSLRLQLHPFQAHESALMLPHASPAERAAAWGVCGGMPYYLAAWDSSTSLRSNLLRLFCNEHALMLSEGHLVLGTEEASERRGERLPEQVLRAVAAGRTSFAAIRSAVNTVPTRVLAELEQARLLSRCQPVTEKPSTKLTYYRIADNFLAFWLSVIEPHRAAIEQGMGGTVVNTIMRQHSDFMGPRWEEALREHTRRLASQGALGGDVVAVGEYWRRQVGPTEDPCQLDVVAVRGDRTVAAVGEAKWAKRQSGRRLINSINRKAELASLPVDAKTKWIACAREEVSDSPPGCVSITAADVFG